MCVCIFNTAWRMCDTPAFIVSIYNLGKPVNFTGLHTIAIEILCRHDDCPFYPQQAYTRRLRLNLHWINARLLFAQNAVHLDEIISLCPRCGQCVSQRRYATYHTVKCFRRIMSSYSELAFNNRTPSNRFLSLNILTSSGHKHLFSRYNTGSANELCKRL